MFLTPPAIARLMKVDPNTVRGWILDGELKAINIAKKTAKAPRFQVKEVWLEEFLASRLVSKDKERKGHRSTVLPHVQQWV